LLREREEASRRKDQFLAMLAHELRNPLGPIRFGAQVLKHELDGQGGEAAESVDLIERQVAHMSRLIDDLLDVSRLTRGRVSLDCQPLELEQLAREVIKVRSAEARNCELRLELRSHDKPVWVKGDADRLTQVLDNLVDNALKFCKPGGTITVGVDREGDQGVL